MWLWDGKQARSNCQSIQRLKMPDEMRKTESLHRFGKTSLLRGIVEPAVQSKDLDAIISNHLAYRIAEQTYVFQPTA